MTSKIEISPRTIFFILILLAGLWLVFFIRDILFLLFISFILMSAMRPLVDRLERYKIHRAIGTLLVYGVVLGGLTAIFAGAIPSLVNQSTRLLQELPTYVLRVAPSWNIDTREITQQLSPIGENLVKVTVGIFSNIVSTITVLVFTFYFLLERRHLEQFLVDTLGQETGKRTADIVRLVEKSLGSWLLGELTLMGCVGLLSYLGLSLLRIDFVLPLAILAGLLEIVPMIGPIVAAVPAVLVALTVSPFLALATVALYFVVQQVENNIFVPIIMKRAVDLPPVITILSLMVGGRLAGITGAVLAIPTVVMLRVVLTELLSKKNG